MRAKKAKQLRRLANGDKTLNRKFKKAYNADNNNAEEKRKTGRD